VDDVYSYPSRPDQQRVQFEALVDEALADGFSGLFVVADNSRLIGATEADFDAWLRWEALADELQSRRPLTGLCYFDAGVVSADRLDALSMMHPVRCRRSATSSFQLYCDDDALRVSGEIDGILADQIRRVFAAAVGATDRELDFSEVDFIDHRALLTLDEVARAGVRVRLRGAKSVVRRLWGLLEVPQPALEFS
jgi:anti-anti-sigma regulatory factor